MEIELYAIQNNEDGTFFNPRSRWVKKLIKAKIYPTKGAAHGVATYLMNQYNDISVSLVIITGTVTGVEDQTTRVAARNAEEQEKYAKWKAGMEERRLKAAEERLRQAQAELDRLKTNQS